ncbi:hypothetical protein HNP49_001929 [Pseudomonas fluvialis]|uniref:Uncharacterized protein n=1 Tax=Pseudomonas fluvialis TaxID=1793966 RepID=A0A7X0BT16_9PSED|nr:PA1571 family protein [Pseudomonas fluvialis]MBB6341761.1 hypothetical protein [Pseudomonas fluvialis]
MQVQNNVQQAPRFTAPAANQALGGSIIDAQGREVPITEAMVQLACRELDNCSLASAKRG